MKADEERNKAIRKLSDEMWQIVELLKKGTQMADDLTSEFFNHYTPVKATMSHGGEWDDNTSIL